jgi:hypothetical protein
MVILVKYLYQCSVDPPFDSLADTVWRLYRDHQIWVHLNCILGSGP